MNEQRFEQLLERCLQAIEHGEDPEVVMGRHPQDAERLRPLMEIARATAVYYADVPEPPGGLIAGRERMLTEAARHREHPRTVPIGDRRRRLRMRLLFATRLMGIVLAAMIGLSAVGGGVAMAAGDSLPGDALYPVKLTVEDIRMALTSDPEAQVALALQLADERTEEIEALIQNGEPIPENVTARMEQHLQRAMRQAAMAPDDMMPGLLEQIAVRTRTQSRVLQRIRENAPEQDQTRLENTQRTCQQLYGEAQAGLEDPVTFRLRHQQRESMPEEVVPPEPPDNEPGPQGPSGPNEDPPQAPQGEENQEQEQNQQGEQNQSQQDGKQYQYQIQGTPPVTPTITPSGYRYGRGEMGGPGR
jgi:hypothetical protein